MRSRGQKWPTGNAQHKLKNLAWFDKAIYDEFCKKVSESTFLTMTMLPERQRIHGALE